MVPIAKPRECNSFLGRLHTCDQRRLRLFALSLALGGLVFTNNITNTGVLQRELAELHRHSFESRPTIKVTIKKNAVRYPAQQLTAVEKTAPRQVVEEEEEQHARLEQLPVLEKKERVITLVHIGKTGGMSLRTSTSLVCHGLFHKNLTLLGACQQKYSNDAPLSRQLRYLLHWSDVATPEILNNSTSFLFSLRSPVDRIVSTFRYSHPGNCNNRTRPSEPWGCTIEKFYHWKTNPSNPAYQMYTLCYPSASHVEDWAQNVMSPWPESPPRSDFCRKLARDLVRGEAAWGAAPHMNWNYRYYVKQTLDALGSMGMSSMKEVLAIRTEHYWDDVVALDRQLGGTGRFQGLRTKSAANNNSTQVTHKVSHGSQWYQPMVPSPHLTKSATHKLCCVLEKELELYVMLLKRAINLSEQSKHESIAALHDQCGIGPSQEQWNRWQKVCQTMLELDFKYWQQRRRPIMVKQSNTTPSIRVVVKKPTSILKAVTVTK